MSDHTAEYDSILARAAAVFGKRSFTFAQLAIECRRRNADIAEALAALVEAKQLERIDGQPVTYRVAAS